MTASSPPPAARQRAPWIRGLAYALSIAALAWVMFLWWDQWPKVFERLAKGNHGLLLAGFAFALASGYANFLAFFVLVRRLMGRSLGLSALSHLYFIAQLLKHLPGRVWGIGYQVAMGGREAAASDWVFANLAHMAAATYVALAMAASVVAWSHAPYWGISLALAASLFFFLARPACIWVASAFSARQGWRARIGRMLAFERLDAGSWVTVLAAFLAAGVFQYGSWAMYAGVVGYGDFEGALVLCGFYMLAWFAGYVAFLTPSGIGVRELVFLGLSTGFDADIVAVMAVVGRASFLAVDVVLSLPFLLAKPKA